MQYMKYGKIILILSFLQQTKETKEGSVKERGISIDKD